MIFLSRALKLLSSQHTLYLDLTAKDIQCNFSVRKYYHAPTVSRIKSYVNTFFYFKPFEIQSFICTLRFIFVVLNFITGLLLTGSMILMVLTLSEGAAMCCNTCAA